MSIGAEFRDAYGAGDQYRAFGPSDRARLEGNVPDYLLELWETDGWAGYRDGLLWTVDPHEYEPLVQLWKLPDAALMAVARTAFGSLYLLREFQTRKGTKGFAILELDPHTGNYSPVGPVARLFFAESLADPEYMTKVLWEPKAKRAARDVGPLAWDEMYGFEPALALGGSGNSETVRRYKLFDHHLLLSQLVEVKIVKF